ncbi:MAG: CD225/dispanin family protein [Lentisphaerae bacterium]|nr:CD225/dispanin family protein [Lentisphaerota bacterium]
MVKTYLVESILVTLLCCMPLGVIAIVFAAHAGSLLAMQQYQLALKSAETAKKWMLASLICGIVFSLLYAAATLVSAAAQNTL